MAAQRLAARRATMELCDCSSEMEARMMVAQTKAAKESTKCWICGCSGVAATAVELSASAENT
jgi:hypothetical protein